MALFLHAINGVRSTTLSHLGQMSLVSPEITLHHLLPKANREATWGSNSVRLFDEEKSQDGLAIGFFSSSNGKAMFGIGRTGEGHLVDSPAFSRTSKGRLPFSLPILRSLRNTKRHFNLPFATIFIVFALLVLILSSGAFLLFYVLSQAQSIESAGTLRTTASLSYVLSASQSIPTAMFLAVPPIMSLHAFRVASVWADNPNHEGPIPSE